MQQIDILMATYNGADYLPQQLCSIINQSMRSWTLYVHDDGSTDATLSIVRRFAAVDSRIKLIEDGVTYHDAGRNFLHLLEYSKAPFAIFCDQDDIWLENKLEKMLEFIVQCDNTKPIAVYSNSYVYDMASSSISGYATMCHPKELKDVFFINSGIQGCALMFNTMLKNICKNIPQYVAMHDHVVTLAALTFGDLFYMDIRLMLYRRHQGTVTGETYTKKTRKAIDFFSKSKTVLSKKHYIAIQSFYETNKNIMPQEKRNVYNDFFHFVCESKLKRLCHVICGNYRLYGLRSILFIKMILRPLL